MIGRGRDLWALHSALDRGRPTLVVLHGPRGRGKTALLAEAFRGRRAVHFQGADLTERDLLRDLEAHAHRVLGEPPSPQRPGVLPVPAGAASWLSLLMGILDRIAGGSEPGILALDGVEPLLAARRKLPSVLAETFDAARVRGVPFTLVLAARDPGALADLVGPRGALGEPDLELRLDPLPFRAAGWAHGGRDPADAFRRWAILGDDPAHLPPPGRSRGLEETVVERVIARSGDLWDAPLRRLESTFQRPARYAAILRALARRPLDWAELLERAGGIDSGGQLAPYLRRLEEEGLVGSALPLGAKPQSRSRRYFVTDPFLAFWFALVLPVRSSLSLLGPRRAWRTLVAPELPGHFAVWMEEAARRWLRDHAPEALPAPAREVGSLWGAEADFPVAGRLANGQVCFGLVDWGPTREGIDREMTARMAETRYGIGREGRTPLFFLAGEAGEPVRRLVARTPHAAVVDLRGLMGDGPP